MICDIQSLRLSPLCCPIVTMKRRYSCAGHVLVVDMFESYMPKTGPRDRMPIAKPCMPWSTAWLSAPPLVVTKNRYIECQHGARGIAVADYELYAIWSGALLVRPNGQGQQRISWNGPQQDQNLVQGYANCEEAEGRARDRLYVGSSGQRLLCRAGRHVEMAEACER